MKVKVRLADSDREQFGCPEWMELDPYSVRATEAFVLQAGFTREGVTVGFDSPAEWRAALRSDKASAVIVLVWLALRRSGTQIPLSDLEFDFDAALYQVIPDADEADDEAGKGEESDPATTS